VGFLDIRSISAVAQMVLDFGFWNINFITNKKIGLQLRNPIRRNSEEAYRAANPVQRNEALNEFMKFKGILLCTGLLKPLADLAFVGDDFLPDGFFAHADRPEPANRPIRPGRKGQHPSPTRGQLRRRADELRDRGLPMAAVAKLLGTTVEAVEELLASPQCQR
jgi:hypothetical protein